MRGRPDDVTVHEVERARWTYGQEGGGHRRMKRSRIASTAQR